MIQISCTLAQFQMSFASLLQEAEMPNFFFDVCNSCCIIHFQPHMQFGYIFAERFQAEKASWQFKGIYVACIFHTILSTSNLCHLICASLDFQTCIRICIKTVISKGCSLMGAKASKMFLIHHLNSIAASFEI